MLDLVLDCVAGPAGPMLCNCTSKGSNSLRTCVDAKRLNAFNKWSASETGYRETGIRKLVKKVLGFSRFREPGNRETGKLVNEDSNNHVMRGVMHAFVPHVTLQVCPPLS